MTDIPTSSDPRSLAFDTLDVFTSAPFAGNPLAVVHLRSAETNRSSQQQKQIIAREFNLSETVFIHHDESSLSNYDTEHHGTWKIDIFMTNQELPLAGHPVIGSAWWLAHTYADLQSATLLCKAGPVHIKVDRSVTPFRVAASMPQALRILQAGPNLQDILQMQRGLVPHTSALQNARPGQERFPVVQLVPGMTFALVELPSGEALDTIAPTPTRVTVPSEEGFIAMYLYTLRREAAKRFTLHTRMIEQFLEDPATGSAACTLSGYLALQAVGADASALADVETPWEFNITQGEKMGRKSDIHVKVWIDVEGTIKEIQLGGSAVQVMNGTLWSR
ncbi:Diaminopimelate epimerase-like protein [Fimicolochytrium jonesii]|uniref:Diaminopimelate epimerase-like protein n=1 Tax=Fimicolochytrium jonesii TaxID=1396493 RepID=UPI0022FE84D9|nr:Diaminopimelate epimerase-like protein [Fimicolochytrium jonesii]KAI8827047.1 Diaminopimelate epimerase-like protein [Fimicolochytrium jonesii]